MSISFTPGFTTLSGLDFVPWLIAVVALIAVSFIGLSTFRETDSLAATAFALALVAWVGASFLSPRPVLFSYALLAALAAALGRPRLRWTLPLIVWLWAAIHGSFVVGIGLIVLHRIARKRPLTAESGCVGGAGVVDGPRDRCIWTTSVEVLPEPTGPLDLISEWAPPNLTSPDLIPYTRW